MGLFNKSCRQYPDFSMIGTDLHSHILPGMDDGSASMAESLGMIREMERIGYRKIIVTPHVISDIYPNTREKILGQLYHLQEMLVLEDIQLTVEASAEYNMDDRLAGRIRTGEVIPFGKDQYLLIELPWQKPTFAVSEVLSQAKQSGYRVIISHPERYSWLIGKMKLYEELKAQGMLFQINLNSLTGVYGFPIKMAANQLVDAGMIEFAGSDAHHLSHIQKMQNVLINRHFIKLVESGKLQNSVL